MTSLRKLERRRQRWVRYARRNGMRTNDLWNLPNGHLRAQDRVNDLRTIRELPPRDNLR